MNYEEFKDKVVEDVRRELESRTGKSYDVQAHTVEKIKRVVTLRPSIRNMSQSYYCIR